MRAPPPYEIEPVWGRAQADRAERLVDFWVDHGAFDEPSARERLQTAACVLTRAGGEVAGVATVRDERVPLVGNRRFWTFGMVLAPGVAADLTVALLGAAREELERHFVPGAKGPIGLFALLGDRTLLRGRPEAFWSDARMIYAGYAPDGRQVRLGLFEDAVV